MIRKTLGRRFVYLVLFGVVFNGHAQSLDIATQAMKGSEYLSLSATVTIDANISDVLPYFHGGETCWDWQLKCKSTKVLLKVNDHHQIIYSVIKMPWPLTNRELIFNVFVKGIAEENTKLSLSKNEKSRQEGNDNNQVVISLKPYTGELEHQIKQTSLVRATSTIEYTLVPLNTNKTKLTIFMHTDFGGTVSPAMINSRLEQSVRQDINALLQLINKKTG